MLVKAEDKEQPEKRLLQKLCSGRTGAEAPILWPPDVKNQLTGKDPDSEKD